MPRPTLNEIGNDPIYNKEIISSAHNENYTSILDYIDEVLDAITDHEASLSAHLDEAILNTSDVDGTKLKDALNKLKTDILNHIGSASAHTSDAIVNVSSITGSKISDAIENIQSNIENHKISTTAHGTDDITNDSAVTGTDLSDVLEQLKGQIDAVVSGGTEVDPRLSQALVDFETTVWTNFKDLQDFWQSRIVDLEDATKEPLVSDEITQFGTAQLGGVYKDQEFQGQSDFLQLEGMTLVNDVVNGDFSDGTTGWAVISGTISDSNNILSVTGNGGGGIPYITQSISAINTGDKYFLFGRARVTNSDSTAIRLTIDGTTGGTQQLIIESNPTENKWYELYGVLTVQGDFTGDVEIRLQHVYADATTADGKIMEVDGISGVFAINMTALGIEDYTEEQMLSLVENGYFEGFGHADGTVTITGKNLFRNDFDIMGFYWNSGEAILSDIYKATKLENLIPGSTVKFSSNEIELIFIIRENDGTTIASASQSLSVIVPDDGILKVNMRNSSVTSWNFGVSPSELNIQLEIGTEATDYEPYHKYTIKSENLKRLPNGVSDIKHVGTGRIWRNIAPVDGDYVTVQSGDITVLLNGANVQRVSIPLTAFPNIVSQSLGIFDKSTRILNFEESVNEGSDWDVTTSAYGYATNQTILFLYLPLGTYASLAEAQADLAEGGPNELRLIYQLATPLIEQGEASQPNLATGGMMYTDSVVAPTVEYAVNLNLASTVNQIVTSLAELQNDLNRRIDSLSAKIVSGVADALVISMLTEPETLQVVTLIPSVTNTTDTTLKINDGEILPIKKVDASGSYVDLVANDLIANKPAQIVVYSDKYVLIG